MFRDCILRLFRESENFLELVEESDFDVSLEAMVDPVFLCFVELA